MWIVWQGKLCTRVKAQSVLSAVSQLGAGAELFVADTRQYDCHSVQTFNDPGLPQTRSTFRAWAKKRMSLLGIASALEIENAPAKLPYAAMKIIFRIMRFRSSTPLPKSIETETSASLTRPHYPQARALADTLRNKCHGLILLDPSDDELTLLSDTVTHNEALWGINVFWLTEAGQQTRIACWSMILAAFVQPQIVSSLAELTDIADDRSPSATHDAGPV